MKKMFMRHLKLDYFTLKTKFETQCHKKERAK